MIATRFNPLGIKPKPYAYEVAYLKSSGKIYIDTGVVLGSKWTVKAKFAVDGYRCFIACGRYNNEAYRRAYMIYLANRRFYRVSSSEWEAISGSPTLASGVLTEATATNDDVYTIECNGTTISARKIRPSNLTTTLFADVYNRGTENETFHDYNGIGSFIAWVQFFDENGTLVFDGHSVVDRQGVACFHDRVTDALLYGKGEGSFIVGERI